jgi:SAM-dependent methyltransferase
MTVPIVLCPSCGATDLQVFYEQTGVPVHSCLLMNDPEEARNFPTGDLRLAFCGSCGFITNTAFDPQLHHYSGRYEETQGFSPRFRQFATSLAERWIERYDLRGRELIEIGCGKGEFLQLICELGDNTGVGIDPSWVQDRLVADSRVQFVQDFYTDTFGPLAADAVICRHTLEHIHPVGEFLRMIRNGIGDRTATIVLFELPDVRRVLEEAAFFDVYYEHCSYFSLGSLARSFRAAGFEVLDLSLDFDGQYLLVEARPSTVPAAGDPLPMENDIGALRELTESFAPAVADRLAALRSQVSLTAEAEAHTTVWGSGSKGVAFLTSLELDDDIPFVVDINPHKHGQFMAGTGHAIVTPQMLETFPPELVFVMNPIYVDEIATMVNDMGVTTELVPV